jgi:hypothetical protein
MKCITVPVYHIHQQAPAFHTSELRELRCPNYGAELWNYGASLLNTPISNRVTHLCPSKSFNAKTATIFKRAVETPALAATSHPRQNLRDLRAPIRKLDEIMIGTYYEHLLISALT